MNERTPAAKSNAQWDLHADHADAISAARGLVPRLRSRAAEAEASRRIPEQTIEDLRSSGLFHLLAPRTFGGSELGIATFVETTAEIASGCGSSGWVYAVLAGHYWTLSLMPLEAQREIFSDPHALIASVIHLSSKPPVRVEGGHLIEDAYGRYCSGVDHANWILAGAAVAVDDDNSEPHYFLIPRAEFDITDDWYAVGLRGTGSKSVAARRIFVPEHRSCSLAEMTQGTAPGIVHHNSPRYRLPFRETQRLQLIGAPIGIARSAMQLCTEICRQHHGTPERAELEDSRAAFVRLANASVELDAAAGLVISDAQALDARSGEAKRSALDSARCLRDIAYAAQQCRRVVSGLFEASGARGLLDENALQRIWRDANAAAAHVAFVRDKADLPFGRAMCGLDA